MFDPNPVSHRCRNPRCKSWLKEPAENPRDAFCCAGCEVGFYRTHCRVCEKELGEAKRNSRRELCGRRQCRNQFRSFRAQLFSCWYPSVIRASKREKSSTKSTPKTTIRSYRPSALGSLWLIKKTREVLRENFKVNAEFWRDARRNPKRYARPEPLGNVGGCFEDPGWDAITSPDGVVCYRARSGAASAAPTESSPSDWSAPPASGWVPIGGHPAWLLEESEPIPEFLRREPNNPVWQKVTSS
jgi:hypothetical protein